jgi:hypothetical protein
MPSGFQMIVLKALFNNRSPFPFMIYIAKLHLMAAWKKAERE